MKNVMKTKKQMTLHDKAVKLCEGGVVWCMGHYVKAQTLETDDFPCFDCKMYSICHDELIDLCAECDNLTNENHMLILVCDQPYYV